MTDRSVSALPLIVAHRGSSHRAPENTLPAFGLARQAGADGIEMDVRLAGDGVPVVFHDATLKRIAGEAASVSGLASRELEAAPVGHWFNTTNPDRADLRYEVVGAPTLEAVLESLEGYSGVIFVELKCSPDDNVRCAESVSEILSGSGLLPNFVVKSFDPATVPVVKRVEPRLRTAALFGRTVLTAFRQKHLVSAAKELGTDSLSLHHSLATKSLMREAAGANMSVAVWTVDDPVWIERAASRGIGTLITNRPEEMIARRDGIDRGFAS